MTRAARLSHFGRWHISISSRCVSGAWPAAGWVLSMKTCLPLRFVGETLNGTMTAGMCHYPAASGPFLPAASAEPGWILSFKMSYDVESRCAAVTGHRWEWPACLLSVLLSCTDRQHWVKYSVKFSVLTPQVVVMLLKSPYSTPLTGQQYAEWPFPAPLEYMTEKMPSVHKEI